MTDSNPTSRLYDVLDWASERDYAGYDYADGMSSPVLKALPGDRKIPNLMVQETIKRSPINIRPLAGVPRRRSFMGAGLFISANLTAHEASGNPAYLRDAIELGGWLLHERSRNPFGWGHNHRLQTLDGTVERNTPSIVTVTFVARALIALQRVGFTPCIDLGEEIEHLVSEELGYEPLPEGARISYRVDDRADYTILNANALGAALLTELAVLGDRPDLLDLAEPIFEYVASRQQPCGGWKYADPASASHLSMDTHHNGFILESFLRHRALTGEQTYASVIEEALSFHEEQLFVPNGAPNWDESSSYPRDIHAAAQGIITFSLAGDLTFARQIIDWTDRRLYHPSGRYMYRQTRWHTRQYTLMRWSQAWMAKALATYIRCLARDKQRISIADGPPDIE